jgi:hypothetical protein
VFSVGLRDVTHGHRWDRKDEVKSLRECDAEELRGDGAGVYPKSGVPLLYILRWEEM